MNEGYTQAEEIDLKKKKKGSMMYLLVIGIYCLSLYYKQDK